MPRSTRARFADDPVQQRFALGRTAATQQLHVRDELACFGGGFQAPRRSLACQDGVEAMEHGLVQRCEILVFDEGAVVPPPARRGLTELSQSGGGRDWHLGQTLDPCSRSIALRGGDRPSFAAKPDAEELEAVLDGVDRVAAVTWKRVSVPSREFVCPDSSVSRHLRCPSGSPHSDATPRVPESSAFSPWRVKGSQTRLRTHRRVVDRCIRFD
jgi:hypothetical protein